MPAEHTLFLGNWSSCVLAVPVLWYGLALPLTVPPFSSLTSGSSAFPLIENFHFLPPKKFLNCLNQPEIIAITFYYEYWPVHLLSYCFPVLFLVKKEVVKYYSTYDDFITTRSSTMPVTCH